MVEVYHVLMIVMAFPELKIVRNHISDERENEFLVEKAIFDSYFVLNKIEICFLHFEDF